MRGVVHEQPAGPAGVRLAMVPDPVPGPGMVRVRVKAAGLNHRDLLQLTGQPGRPTPVLGSDGAGVVDAVGEGVRRARIGDDVVINPSLGWETISASPPPTFQILGVPRPGTLAEWIVVPEANVEPKPPHLSWEEAGVLGLAGLTAWRALFTKGALEAGQTVLIPGIGGGVATIALLFAKASGATVAVTSRDPEKRARALALGADLALDTDSDWLAQLEDPVDLVVESIGEATWDRSLLALKAGGRLVTFGAHTGSRVLIDLRDVYRRQLTVMGTTMGSAEEFRAMLRFVNQHQLRPAIDRVFRLEEAAQAFRRLEQAAQFGKVGLLVPA